MDSVAGLANGGNFEGTIRIEEDKIRSHVDEVVRQTVEQTLNGLLEAEADELCGPSVALVRPSGSTCRPVITIASCTRRRAK